MLRGETFSGSNWKPTRGSSVLAKEQSDADAKVKEIEVKKAVKAHDIRCRWPERHKCRGGLEAAHMVDASLGGEMVETNLITVCAWVHRRGPESIHGKQLEIRPLSKRLGARGPCAFYRKVYSETRKGEFMWRLVRREVAVGQWERD